MHVFEILAKVEMESPLHGDKHGVRGGQEFSQQEKGCFLLKAGRAMGKPQDSARQTSHEKKKDKCRAPSLQLKSPVIWL